MRKVGEVISILNRVYFLVKTTKRLDVGAKVTVFQEINLIRSQQKKAHIKKVIIPKGNYMVVSLQDINKKIYLLSFEKTKVATRIKSSPTPSFYDLSTVFGAPDQTQIKISEDDSADLDQDQSLNININPKVQIGDYIAES